MNHNVRRTCHHDHAVGASIRRYNEVALNNDVQSLIAGWKDQLASCNLIFLQAPVRSRTTFYNSKESGGKLYFN